ncbi:hypothetical protein TSAR_004066 [Trichomalopsis sarcophagae]|uniref:Uncharacterized protein n=1 Tax=Trichomalopsis sarcophagae TaxID=543379 RepID=A0A232EY12_9HYME|nr:hypothetical protein TSAR_004066 [Trichomalopsis sarcophagae]
MADICSSNNKFLSATTESICWQWENNTEFSTQEDTHCNDNVILDILKNLSSKADKKLEDRLFESVDAHVVMSYGELFLVCLNYCLSGKLPFTEIWQWENNTEFSTQEDNHCNDNIIFDILKNLSSKADKKLEDRLFESVDAHVDMSYGELFLVCLNYCLSGKLPFTEIMADICSSNNKFLSATTESICWQWENNTEFSTQEDTHCNDNVILDILKNLSSKADKKLEDRLFESVDAHVVMSYGELFLVCLNYCLSDYMHCVLAGVVTQLTDCILCDLPNSDIEKIDQLLINIKEPN